MTLKENLKRLQESLPKHVQLIAVSKTKPVADIQTLYDAGNLDFGENRVQELIEKQAVLPSDIRWHLIGNLQRNKVKYIAQFVHLIHSVESERLLKEINKQAKQNDRVISCLLQIRIAKEETKFGLEKEEAERILTTYKELYPHVKIVGLMGMATFTENEDQIRNEFKELKSIYDSFKNHDESLEILSMGMSGDYKIAIEEGSTMIRVGSLIFGERTV